MYADGQIEPVRSVVGPGQADAMAVDTADRGHLGLLCDGD